MLTSIMKTAAYILKYNIAILTTVKRLVFFNNMTCYVSSNYTYSSGCTSITFILRIYQRRYLDQLLNRDTYYNRIEKIMKL